MRRHAGLKWLLGCSLAWVVLLASAVASAATINVTTTTDGGVTGECSLRSAITAANTNSSQQTCAAGSGSVVDIIQVPPGPYYLGDPGTYWDEDNNQSGDLDISSNLIIRGSDVRSTLIIAAPRDRIFHVYSAPSAINVSIEKMTLVGGDVSANASYTGGTLLSIETLTLKDLVVRDGRALWGGNLHTITSATQPVTLENVSILDGYATNTGSGVYFDDSSTSLPPASNFRNVTISGNHGIAVYVEGKLGLHSSTVANNRRGGLLVRQSTGGSLWIANSIIANNVDNDQVANDVYCTGSGTFGTNFHSMIGSVDAFTCDTQGQVGPVSGDPRLSPAFDFGSGIPVHALQPGSVAINAGNPDSNGAWSNCLSLDARGVSRAAPPCDIGAYESRFDVTVNSTVDFPDATPGNGICASIANTCTLRALFMEASASGGRWMASVPAGTYALNLPIGNQDGEGGDLDVKPGLGTPPLSLALFGPGDADAVHIAGGADRVLEIRGKNVGGFGEPDNYRPIAFALLGATLRNGHLVEDPFQPPEENCCLFGGGVNIDSARVLLTDVVVRDNTIDPGDGVFGYGAGLNVDQIPVQVMDPQGNAAFLPYSTALHLERFAVTGNTVSGSAGNYGGMKLSIYSPYPDFPLEPSLLRNGTVSGNSAYGTGGLLVSGGANNDAHLSYVTVTGNTATSPAPTETDGARLSAAVINNSILSGNAGSGHARDCTALNGVLGLGHVVTGSTQADCAIVGDATGNQYETNAGLGPLETFANGMQGHRLLLGSPLLDLIPLNYCWDTRLQANRTDSRGVFRPGVVQPASFYCTPGAIEGDGYDIVFRDGFDS